MPTFEISTSNLHTIHSAWGWHIVEIAYSHFKYRNVEVEAACNSITTTKCKMVCCHWASHGGKHILHEMMTLRILSFFFSLLSSPFFFSILSLLQRRHTYTHLHIVCDLRANSQFVCVSVCSKSINDDHGSTYYLPLYLLQWSRSDVHTHTHTMHDRIVIKSFQFIHKTWHNSNWYGYCLLFARHRTRNTQYDTQQCVAPKSRLRKTQSRKISFVVFLVFCHLAIWRASFSILSVRRRS